VRENERLQKTVRAVKDDSMKIMEHNETQRKEFSNLKVELDQSKSKEVKLEHTLRAVKDASMKITEQNETLLRDFSSIKVQLDQSKFKEVKLEQALRRCRMIP